MGAEHRADELNRLAGDELGEGKRMGADVADAAADPGLRRVVAPAGLLVALPGDIGAELSSLPHHRTTSGSFRI